MVEHWVESAASRVEETFGYKDEIIGNGGLSVSGLQHVGRLRGEITTVSSVLRILRRRGYNTRHFLVLYTVDPWKGKDAQLMQFQDPEKAKTHRGKPLYMVPDPHGCHDSWVDHYWEDFGNYLDSFAEGINIVSTRELYESDERMLEFVLKVLEKRDAVIRILNRYRGRKPYRENYIPFEAICQKCGRIDTTETVSVDAANLRARYKCHSCNHEGWQSLRKGKLNWRLEWVGIWYSLDVSFEPYGKDHATPGGSRDSCKDLALNVFGILPPVGLAYEWVGYEKGGRDLGDMGSSDFIGFTPKDWMEVAEAEVLRYIYLSNPPMKRIVLSLEKVPRYTDEFDRAERIYYDAESTALDEKAIALIRKAYELSLLTEPEPDLPIQLPYLHAVALVQTLSSGGENLDEAIDRLRKTKYILREPTCGEVRRIGRRLALARNWLRKYAPSYYRIRILEEFDPGIAESIPLEIAPKLMELRSKLHSIEWTEEKIKEAMISIEKRDRKEERMFFSSLYKLFFGKPHGPRIAPYMAMLDRNFVLRRLDEFIAYKLLKT